MQPEVEFLGTYPVRTDTAQHLDDARIETTTLYELTDLGRSLDQPLTALAKRAEANWKAVEVAREQWEARRPVGN